MASDSGMFRNRDQLEREGWTMDSNVFERDGRRMLPLYEAKMIYQFDHRYGDYRNRPESRVGNVLPRIPDSAKSDPYFVTMPLYWVQDFDTINEQKSKPEKTVYDLGVMSRLKAKHWDRDWLLVWRDITNVTNERTMIWGILPRFGIGHTCPLALSLSKQIGCFYANLTSFVLDYVARQKLAGTHLTYGYLNQLPVLPPDEYETHTAWQTDSSVSSWVEPRVLELTFTAWDMAPFARFLGDEKAPFRWDEARRTLIRAELDAAYFHLYGLKRDEVEHVMGSFDALRRREEKPQNFGEFRTKRLILERYDAMSDAARTGTAYQTILDPPPGRGPRHPARRTE
jgi:hypothetical protein